MSAYRTGNQPYANMKKLIMKIIIIVSFITVFIMNSYSYQYLNNISYYQHGNTD